MWGVRVCRYVGVAGAGGWSMAAPAPWHDHTFGMTSLSPSSGPGLAPLCPHPPSAPASSHTHLLVFSRTSTFFRSSKFSVEQDSTLQKRKKNVHRISRANAQWGAGVEGGGVQRRRTGNWLLQGGEGKSLAT